MRKKTKKLNEELNKEDRKALKKSEDDFKKGKTVPHKKIMKYLNS